MKQSVGSAGNAAKSSINAAIRIESLQISSVFPWYLLGFAALVTFFTDVRWPDIGTQLPD
ncbi:hypothetical protein [Winslowiella iniecta]|uniref:Uncharacterized protein n=1 Tax=Winslowiella iniecta TaxID=1560201 RepID=A0A0L7T6V2_9GAMM|nr:hypothetical protein [Winslowiella iniecta]KOC91080.1 hypothetical protein NG42_06445 [Winslowiella iniecta]KOC93780.1 hypothetical protein NG43_08695 [Winslowiella iniecta]